LEKVQQRCKKEKENSVLSTPYANDLIPLVLCLLAKSIAKTTGTQADMFQLRSKKKVVEVKKKMSDKELRKKYEGAWLWVG
jgi:hypothetical protein